MQMELLLTKVKTNQQFGRRGEESCDWSVGNCPTGGTTKLVAHCMLLRGMKTHLCWSSESNAIFFSPTLSPLSEPTTTSSMTCFLETDFLARQFDLEIGDSVPAKHKAHHPVPSLPRLLPPPNSVKTTIQSTSMQPLQATSEAATSPRAREIKGTAGSKQNPGWSRVTKYHSR